MGKFRHKKEFAQKKQLWLIVASSAIYNFKLILLDHNFTSVEFAFFVFKRCKVQA